MDRVQRFIRVTPEIYKEIKIIAFRENRPFYSVVDEALADYLEKKRKKAEPKY
jgi:predicted transcriptional regulator